MRPHFGIAQPGGKLTRSPRWLRFALLIGLGCALCGAAPTPTESTDVPEAIVRSAEAPLPSRIDAVRQIQADPDRDAIGRLVRLLREGLPPEVRAALVESLVARTGRDDLGADAEEWAAWWKDVSFLQEGEWRRRLAEWQGQRAARLQVQRDAALRRLSDVLPRLHSLTPPEGRSDLIAGLIRDELPEVSRLGLDLAARALLNAQTLGEPVRLAAIESLQRRSPEVRAAAARLLENLSPDDAAVRAAVEALATETDDRAAQSLLRLASHRPTASLGGPALAWLTWAGPAGDAAADAMIASQVAGTLAQADRARALAQLRDLPASQWRPSMVRLLGAIGDQDGDQQALLQIATESTGPQRDAAMEALVQSDAGLAMLEAAAGGREELTSPLARAVAARRPSAAGLWSVLRAAGTDDPGHVLAHDIIVRMEPDEVEAASMLMDGPAMRNRLLTCWLESKRASEFRDASARLWVAAARCREACADGLGALEALDSAAQRWTTEPRGVRELRAAALLRSGCAEDAAAFSRDPEAWMRTLESWGDGPGLGAARDGLLGVLGCPPSHDLAMRLLRVDDAGGPSGGSGAWASEPEAP